jgi:hypothetical protein
MAVSNRRPAQAWAPAELDQLRVLVAEGKTQREMGAALGRPKGSISNKLLELRLHTARGPGKAQTHWTTEQTATLLSMIKQGKSWREIGEVLNRAEATLRFQAKRQGVRKQASSKYAKPLADAVGRHRSCLGPVCRGRKTFLSTGPGHRVCQNCREAMLNVHGGYV